MRRVGLMLAAASFFAIGTAQAADKPRPEPAEFGFRFLGPVVDNRIASFAAAPGDHLNYYAGAASGGIFKSENGGGEWKPVFDDQNVAAIGALAVAPSDPKTVWAGTGEAWAIRAYSDLRREYYRTRATFRVFGKGWLRRVDAVEKAALELAE